MHMPQVFKSHGYHPQSNKGHIKNCNTLSRQSQVPAHNRQKMLFRHLMSFVKISMFEDWLNESLLKWTLEQHKLEEEHNSLAQSAGHCLPYTWYTKCKNAPIASRYLSFLPYTSWMHDYNTVLNSKLISYVEMQKSTSWTVPVCASSHLVVLCFTLWTIHDTTNLKQKCVKSHDQRSPQRFKKSALSSDICLPHIKALLTYTAQDWQICSWSLFGPIEMERKKIRKRGAIFKRLHDVQLKVQKRKSQRNNSSREAQT